MTAPVRVRFAPSPTGFVHAGNIHTAIFDYLLARHTGGKFILRIEDTDVERKEEGAVEYMMDALKWLGLEWDEGPDVGGPYGPYVQSKRLQLYKEAAERLVAQGNAYKCYCSPERLEQMRRDQEARKQPPGYDRLCRNLTDAERAAKEAEGIKPVIRFKVPDEGRTQFHDIIYGDVAFENKTIDDFVMLKSDGFPTYHLANVVDDTAMKITHVIRGEEWISSTPRHLLMYKAFGYDHPEYIHMPVIVGADRAKLSKRRGAISLLQYRDMGYLSEAMFNFLVLIGWSLDDKTEIMTRRQIIENFSVERMGKTAAAFNQDKLDWMNGMYVRTLTPGEFTQRAMPFLEKGLPDTIKRPIDKAYAAKVLPLAQDRTKKLTDVAPQVTFFFAEELKYDTQTLIAKNMDPAGTLKIMEVSLNRLQKLPAFDDAGLEALLRPLAEELGVKAGQLFSTLRTAVSGEMATPPLFQMMSALGKDRCVKRIAEAIKKLNI
jgi:glutamyl-tRNA synthetase